MRKKILIIEDSGDIGDALKLLIELEGYTAVVASTGSEGREKAVSERPDLILMDIALPDIDGVDLTRELRSLPETAAIPIVCVSSYSGPLEQEAREAGCDAVYSKTSFMTDYAATIRKYIK
jgi:two-component system, cell cycle response regulator DivK